MYKLPRQGLKVLKLIHLVLIVGWLGGGMAMNLLAYQMSTLDNQAGLLAAFNMIEAIAVQLASNCAMVTIVIGLIYGIFTNWGFIKHPWVILKWLISIFVIITGSIYTSAYLDKMQAAVEQSGAAALQSPAYQALAQANLRLGIAQLMLLVLAVALSIWKPWSKNKTKNLQPKQ